jgi:hypothetical protein
MNLGQIPGSPNMITTWCVYANKDGVTLVEQWGTFMMWPREKLRGHGQVKFVGLILNTEDRQSAIEQSEALYKFWRESAERVEIEP